MYMSFIQNSLSFPTFLCSRIYLIQPIQITVNKVSWISRDSRLLVLIHPRNRKFLTSLEKINNLY